MTSQGAGLRQELADIELRSRAAALPGGRFRLALAGLVLAIVLSSLDQNIVATALPTIAVELGNIAQLSWIVTAFMLSATIAAPLYGKLSDMYGRRRLLICSIAIFLVASTLCSVAVNMEQLVIFRAAQGAGAGGLIALSQSAIGDLVGPRQRGRYQGLFSGAMSVSTVAGPLLGGLLLAFGSWRWIFWATLPLGGLALLLLVMALPDGRQTKRHQPDVLGALFWIVGAAFALLFFGAMGAPGAAPVPKLIAIAITAVVFTGLFLWRERRAQEPILGLKLFRIQGFAVAVAAATLMTFAMQASMVFLPLYFQAVLGMTPALAGLMLLPQVAGMIASSTVGGQRCARSGAFKRYFVVGVGLEAVALVLLVLCALLNLGTGPFLVAIAILGLGTGLGMPNAIVIVQNSVPRSELGAATGTMSFMRSFGGTVGVAVSGCVMRFALGDTNAGATDGLLGDRGEHLATVLRFAIGSSFACGALLMIVALFVSAGLPSSTPDMPVEEGA